MTISKNDAFQPTRREALGLLGTAAAALVGAAAGARLEASATGHAPVQVQGTLKGDQDPAVLAATLSFF